MKVKLPRKRKKRYIKYFSKGDYCALLILEELLIEVRRKIIYKNTFPMVKAHGYIKNKFW